jgi:putative phage-type endonuclease
MSETSRIEWLEKRKSGITGTGASAIVGKNPYKSNIDYWEEKTGRRVEPDISDKDFVQYGQRAEEHLIALFALDFPQYEVKHKDFDLRVHPKYPFLIGSLDGELTEKETGRKGILEIKTTNILQSRQYEKWNDMIPENYLYQTLHYLLVTGYDFVVLKAQLKRVYDGNDVRLDTRHYYFERKDVEVLLADLLEKELHFWNEYVLKDVRPPLILPEL